MNPRSTPSVARYKLMDPLKRRRCSLIRTASRYHTFPQAIVKLLTIAIMSSLDTQTHHTWSSPSVSQQPGEALLRSTTATASHSDSDGGRSRSSDGPDRRDLA